MRDGHEHSNSEGHPSHRRLTIRGETHTIHWPPTSEEEWEILSSYFDLLNHILHKMRRALVSLEKKCHWGMPTQPVLRKHCVYSCRDDEGNPVDPTDSGDEGDGSGAGSDQQEEIDWTS